MIGNINIDNDLMKKFGIIAGPTKGIWKGRKCCRNAEVEIYPSKSSKERILISFRRDMLDTFGKYVNVLPKGNMLYIWPKQDGDEYYRTITDPAGNSNKENSSRLLMYITDHDHVFDKFFGSHSFRILPGVGVPYIEAVTEQEETA